MNLLPSIETIAADFKELSPVERLQYLSEFDIPACEMPEANCMDVYLVKGCQSPVWIALQYWHPEREIEFACATDSMTVKSLLALVMSIYNHKTPEVIAAIDFEATIRPLELRSIISPQRMNGLFSIRDRVLLLANGCR